MSKFAYSEIRGFTVHFFLLNIVKRFQTSPKIKKIEKGKNYLKIQLLFLKFGHRSKALVNVNA